MGVVGLGGIAEVLQAILVKTAADHGIARRQAPPARQRTHLPRSRASGGQVLAC
jgi:hypothetical protein